MRICDIGIYQIKILIAITQLSNIDVRIAN